MKETISYVIMKSKYYHVNNNNNKNKIGFSFQPFK